MGPTLIAIYPRKNVMLLEIERVVFHKIHLHIAHLIFGSNISQVVGQNL
jgi:hypothetical protein